MSVAKHQRLRFYTSVEEAILMRVWRKHLHDISSYTDNLPVFREIADELQKHGVRLNKQEVRRRLNSYRNKYLNECSHMERTPGYKSEWRLFALVHMLFHPKNPSADNDEAQKVLEAAAARARAELPALPPMLVTTNSHLKFERDPDGCAFLDAKPCHIPPPEGNTKPSNEPYNSVKSEAKPTESELSNGVSHCPLPRATEDILRRPPLAPANHQLPDANMPLTAKINGLPNADRMQAKRRRGRRSILPRNGQITMAQVEQLRKENQMLQEQNEANLLELKQKEKHFLSLQETFQTFLSHQQVILGHMLRENIKLEPCPGY
ncbi:hypothetical protein KR032_003875 [Drosophila birchii]|nr:hypothetical protein KR032_003875 [Drosophila birchii]